MQISPKGDKLIQASESLRLVGYFCPAGIPTWGWGHTGPEVRVGQAITMATAQADYASDKASKAEGPINRFVKVPLNQNQFDALGSFVFNVGAGNFQSSTLLRLLNAGDYDGAANQFSVWNKGRVNGALVVLPGLATRRGAEKALFTSPMVAA
ncbi:lysozyme [Burkholderia stagnalis]|uniref:lysozyme n=1 Tax=Burkholderia stagnalis TaxID=1503054 RepID=UPI000F568368|nr:lysozyme [Burkholderia stagnalis]RQQ37078.1 lysozyme [Burkholderia stagnalis]RQQ55635.1 lysozyme [Burkholderia stagnalis]RQY19096.1 lysozyme [Burkholderia stagnalis]RQY64219.1 lysozyme [Burkholderia stagnalis]RQY70406.1 lysozyme [Burkholderia stagnalis]